MAVAKAAHLVNMKYLEDLILATNTKTAGSDSHDMAFSPPDVSKQIYFPELATSLITEEQAKSLLMPNPQRLQLFLGVTALFVFAANEPDSSLRPTLELFEACKGDVKLLSVQSSDLGSAANTQRVLRPFQSSALSKISTLGPEAKHAPDGGLVVLVHNAPSYVDEEWYKYLVEATRSMNIRMADLGHTEVANAVLYCDVRKHLNSIASLDVAEDRLMPPNPSIATHPPLPSSRYEAPPGSDDARDHSRSALEADRSQGQSEMEPAETTRAPVVPEKAAEGSHNSMETGYPQGHVKTASSNAERFQETRPRPRAPARRYNAFNVLFGPQPSSQDTLQSEAGPKYRKGDDQEDEVRQPPSAPSQLRPPKRRAAPTRSRVSDVLGYTQDDEGGAGSSSKAPSSEDYRASKRFRALLDAEEVRANPTQELETDIERQLASDELPDASDSNPASLKAPSKRSLAEDSETEHGRSIDKDKAARSSGRDFDAVQETLGSSRQDRGRSETTLHAKPAGSNPGGCDSSRSKATTSANSLDTDTDFIQALSMRKRGKNATVDEFDREFNNLRLVKSNAEQRFDAPDRDGGYEVWQELDLDDQFGAPVGNFVQVDFVPLMRGTAAAPSHPIRQQPRQKEGAPDFKKFKSRTRADRKRIALDLVDGPSFGLDQTNAVESLPQSRAPMDDSLEPVARNAGTMPPRQDAHGPVSILQALGSASDSDDDHDR